VFDPVRHHDLGEQRVLTVEYNGEGYGWSAYIAGESDQVGSPSETPEEAIVRLLDLDPGDPPEWVIRLSANFMADLYSADRYICDCCGFRTLLQKDRYEGCRVCGWEDDPSAIETPSGGPNGITLHEARQNFKRFRASRRDRLGRVRNPRPDERV
jgi:hypothetical protein